MPDIPVEARLRLELVRAEARIGDLESELAAVTESTEAIPDDEHDAEGSTVAYERARVQALLGHARRTRSELEAAVGRIARGTYRRCERCRGDIPAERLAARPATRTCVGCAGPGAGTDR